jgi:hypothetical protein
LFFASKLESFPIGFGFEVELVNQRACLEEHKDRTKERKKEKARKKKQNTKLGAANANGNFNFQIIAM